MIASNVMAPKDLEFLPNLNEVVRLDNLKSLKKSQPGFEPVPSFISSVTSPPFSGRRLSLEASKDEPSTSAALQSPPQLPGAGGGSAKLIKDTEKVCYVHCYLNLCASSLCWSVSGAMTIRQKPIRQTTVSHAHQHAKFSLGAVRWLSR